MKTIASILFLALGTLGHTEEVLYCVEKEGSIVTPDKTRTGFVMQTRTYKISDAIYLADSDCPVGPESPSYRDNCAYELQQKPGLIVGKKSQSCGYEILVFLRKTSPMGQAHYEFTRTDVCSYQTIATAGRCETFGN